MKYKNLQIIWKPTYNNSKRVDGIRDQGGMLLFFPEVTRYQGQQERYDKEMKEQFDLAHTILNVLEHPHVPLCEECQEVECECSQL